ncbi:sodium hydrogen exchanger [Stylonychia lemnae]|uniref:Sodium hydrogen exchanger n=1 Tax=Stylonychia lemnae TaxID=5949 RepID=A0A078A4F2_STYLE|nr:sodium hydrogen exchanger [Stylonychia lemnae]|eukprot:CDW76774.1 sodium hydrogen exchanger [Stylonychia lemnae]
MAEHLAITLIFCALLTLSYTLTSHFLSHSKVLHESIQFSERSFFYVILPPIIFAAGYTLKRKNFVKNIAYILTLGVIGTIITMIVQSTILIYANQMIFGQDAFIQPLELLLLTLISEDKYQTLNSVLFGEGIVNDSVSILLFRAINELIKNQTLNNEGASDKGDSIISRENLIDMSFQFIQLSICSLLLGISVGLFTSLILKHMPNFHNEPHKEIIIILVFAYTSYLLSEHFEQSGIITLFCCGFTMSHYAYHNVSQECQVASKIIVETASQIAESFLFVYLGLSALSIQTKFVYPSLIIVVLLGVVIARFISVIIPVYFLNILQRIMNRNQERKIKNGLKWNETILISIGGIIRGAIAFGLVIQINTNNSEILTTTTQIVVLLTTVILGSSMGLIAQKLDIKPDNENLENKDLLDLLLDDQHKNDEEYKASEEPRKYPKSIQWFKEFDHQYMFPLFKKSQHHNQEPTITNKI